MKLTDRLANGRTAAAMVGVFVVVTLLWFRLGPAAALTQTGIPLLDTQTGYTPDQAYAQLGAYGELGRSRYVLFLIGDFFWILFFGVTIASVLLVALRRLAREEGAWSWVLLAPAGVVAFDWLENLSLLALTLGFPDRFNSLAAAAPFFTAAKTILSNITIFLFVMAVLAIAVSYAIRLRRAAT